MNNGISSADIAGSNARDAQREAKSNKEEIEKLKRQMKMIIILACKSKYIHNSEDEMNNLSKILTELKDSFK